MYLKKFILLFIFLFFIEYSKGNPNDFSFRFCPQPSVMLTPNFFKKLFGPENTERFKQKEDELIEMLKAGAYSKALEKTRVLEKEATKSNADYWICVSYHHYGFIARCQKDYNLALQYYFKIVNYKGNPFSNDQERMLKVYSNIADIYKRLNNTDEAINYFKKSLALKDKLKDRKKLISTYVNLGSIYSSQNKYADAKDCYLNGLNLGNGEPDNISSIIYNNLGNDEYSQGNYSKASEYYMKSIRISEKINDLDGLALSYNNLGNIYASGLKKPDKAIEYFSKSLEIEKKKNNPEGIAWELISIGNIYTTQNKISEAEKSLTDALQIFRSSNNINGIAKSLEDLGALYNVTGNSKKAIETLSKCIAYVEKNEAQVNLASVYNNLGALYFYQKQYNKALPYYFKAFNLANLANDKNMIKRIYSGLQDSYAQLGQFDKAYRYLKEYSALKDTLLDATISEQIIDIQEKYEKNKMEQKVTLQTLEIRNKSLQRNGIFAFLVLSIILFSSALYIIFQKRKNEKLLYEKNSKIKDQEIRNLVQESEIKSMLSMADGQENERQRISRELHDRVGSMLAVIKLNLSAYNQGNFPFVQENLSLIDNTYQEVRNISHNLHAGLLNQFGLKVALNDLKRSVESSHAINFNLTFHENLQVLPRETEVIIFRILQELITNVLKHASAKNLDLQINNSEDHACSITVEDDGNGFDPGKKEGIGLKNINYRLSSIGGSMEINSQPGKGTFILLEIPIFDEEKVPNK